MAALSTSLSSSSHALLGLGFSDYGLANHRRHNVTGNRAASSRLVVVHNSSIRDEDSVVLRVRSGDGAELPKASVPSSLQFGSVNGDAELGNSMHKTETRSQLLRNLSEANQFIRTLQHELREKDDAMHDTRREISALANEFQILTNITQEISRQGINPGTRKINGRYIHSHLISRLREMQEVLQERIKNFYLVQTRSVDLLYCGMAEDVQVMGSFDGWTRGDQMSPESTGTFTKFTTTMKLRPGRYEIKFLVDGEWLLSPDLPTTGEGLTMNNLLIVD